MPKSIGCYQFKPCLMVLMDLEAGLMANLLESVKTTPVMIEFQGYHFDLRTPEDIQEFHDWLKSEVDTVGRSFYSSDTVRHTH